MSAFAQPALDGTLHHADRSHVRTRAAGFALAVAATLAGCASAPLGAPPAITTPSGPTAAAPAAPGRTPPAAAAGVPGASDATTARAYRRDAASHLYALNAARIYRGRLPAMLYAIGTLEVQLDRSGQVLSTHWLRAPRHAPEVVAEIERTVRAAAPFPAPQRLGKVIYTDTWLWDESGRFQLDTLTEGQD